jgi:hypothetical protein
MWRLSNEGLCRRQMPKSLRVKTREVALKFASLLKMLRYLQIIFIASGTVTVASIAHASMTCMRIDEFPVASDPLAREQLEAHVRALPGLKKYEIRDIDGRFFMVLADDGYCKEIPRCVHRLLDLRNGSVKDVFAFRGTGRAWRLMSPITIWLELLQDEYSTWAFATTDNTFIGVQLPRFRDTVVIDSPPPGQTKWLQAACDALTK